MRPKNLKGSQALFLDKWGWYLQGIKPYPFK